MRISSLLTFSKWPNCILIVILLGFTQPIMMYAAPITLQGLEKIGIVAAVAAAAVPWVQPIIPQEGILHYMDSSGNPQTVQTKNFWDIGKKFRELNLEEQQPVTVHRGGKIRKYEMQ